MKKIFLLFILMLNFLIKAQTSEPSILQSLNKIYQKYNDSCKIKEDIYLKKFKIKYKKSKLSLDEILAKDEDYKNAFLRYQHETVPFKENKINDLENLVLEVEKNQPILGKKMVGCLKEGKTIEDIQSSPLYKNLEVIVISEAEFNKNETEFTSVSAPIIRKEITNNFPTDLLENNDGETLRTKLSFFVDTDGSLKRVKSSGENVEFNLLGILSLYSIKKKINPVQYKGENVIATFGVPLTLNFQ